MWVVIELLAIPAVFLIGIIALGVLQNLSPGAIALGLVILAALVAALWSLVRFVRRLERDEGIEERLAYEGAHFESRSDPANHEPAVAQLAYLRPMSAAAMDGEPKGDGVEPKDGEPKKHREPETDRKSEDEELDLVDECGDESFPASDPPAWTLGPPH